MGSKENLTKAKKDKKDEFYTRREDIEIEVQNYWKHFEGKKIFCNCDDPELLNSWGEEINLQRFDNKKKRIDFYKNHKNKVVLDNSASQFWVYFHKQFKQLGLKELVATHYREDGKKSFQIRYDGNGDDNNIYDFDLRYFEESNGDFRSKECIELLKKADIVITNPPFSLFREYIALIVKYKKDFLIIGNINAISYKEIFPLLKNKEMWLGNSKAGHFFKVPKTYEINPKANSKIDEYGNQLLYIMGSLWYTNLDLPKRHEDLIMVRQYKGNELEYPKYDNYDAINVDHIKDIPEDYYGVIGVPISFLLKHNPNQFKIIGLGIGKNNFTPTKKYEKFRDPITKEFISDKRDFLLYVKDDNGKYLTNDNYRVRKIYARILIKRIEKINGESN
ncbi:MAG: adenine-specific methyltransferase EcoRI family protein [Mycoplasmoidaceae bacterium]